jgi:hypothetical protein
MCRSLPDCELLLEMLNDAQERLAFVVLLDHGLNPIGEFLAYLCEHHIGLLAQERNP